MIIMNWKKKLDRNYDWLYILNDVCHKEYRQLAPEIRKYLIDWLARTVAIFLESQVGRDNFAYKLTVQKFGGINSLSDKELVQAVCWYKQSNIKLPKLFGLMVKNYSRRELEEWLKEYEEELD